MLYWNHSSTSLTLPNFLLGTCSFSLIKLPYHGVQCKMISVDNVFVFFR